MFPKPSLEREACFTTGCVMWEQDSAWNWLYSQIPMDLHGINSWHFCLSLANTQMTFISRTYWHSLLLLWFIWAWEVDPLFLCCYCLIKGVSQPNWNMYIYSLLWNFHPNGGDRRNGFRMQPLSRVYRIQHLGVGCSRSSLDPADTISLLWVESGWKLLCSLRLALFIVRMGSFAFSVWWDFEVFSPGPPSSWGEGRAVDRGSLTRPMAHACCRQHSCQLLRLQLNVVRA